MTPSGPLTTCQVENGVWLTYTIHFQNTGTDTAFTVRLEAPISTRHQLLTLDMLSSSDPFEFKINSDREGIWTFNSILLPDSNINEPASHGFVKFRIKSNPGLTAIQDLELLADIYFDFNTPIRTNTSVVDIVEVIIELQSASSCGAEDAQINASLPGCDGIFEFSLDAIVYQSSSLFDSLGPGSYTVSARDTSGEVFTSSIIHIIEPIPVFSTIVTDAISGSDGSIEIMVVGGSSGHTYSLNGGPFQASPIFSSLSGGIYTVTVMNSFGCSVSDSVIVDNIISVPESIPAPLSPSAHLFPNPNSGLFQLELKGFTSEVLEIAIFDYSGKKYYSQVLPNIKDLHVLDLKDKLNAGYYLLRVSGAQDVSKVLGIVILPEKK